QIMKVAPQAKEASFVFRLTPQQYTKEYGDKYAKPKWWARFFGVVFKLLPKIGPFRPLAFKVPTREAEQLFLDSFVATEQRYRDSLAELRAQQLKLPNRDLDTGYRSGFGEYSLADRT